MIGILEKMSNEQLEHFATNVMKKSVSDTKTMLRQAKHDLDIYYSLYKDVEAYVEEHYYVSQEKENLRFEHDVLHLVYTCIIERDGDEVTYPFQWNVQFVNGAVQHETHTISPHIPREDHTILVFYFQNINLPLQYSHFVSDKGDKGKGLHTYLRIYWSKTPREYVYKSSYVHIFNQHMIKLCVKGLESVELDVCYDARKQCVRWVNCLSLGFTHLKGAFDEQELAHYITEKSPCRLTFIFEEKNNH